METKQCRKCGQVKPVTEFHKAGFQNGIQQYRTKCAACNIKPRTAERWALREQGLKRCTKCGEIKPLVDFYPDNRKLDGTKPDCKVCFGESVKEYRSTPRGHAIITASAKHHRETAKWRETHRKYMKRTRDEKRYVQQERARKHVWDKVRRNGFPRPTEHACADCGAPATQYHHESYEREHWLDVTPLCDMCHKRRHCNA